MRGVSIRPEVPLKARGPLLLIPTLLMTLAWSLPGAFAAPTTRVQVRIVTGHTELAAGSVVELRIYEAGKNVVRAPLTHGESWPGDSTRLIPVILNAPIDPRAVLRFALYYRASSPLSPPWEVVAADVDASTGLVPDLFLSSSLSGVVPG